MTAWHWGPGPFLIAGPCVVENDATMLRIGEVLAGISERLKISICFKASFDKANRSYGDTPRGPGIDAGLAALERVRRETGLPILTDVHEVWQVAVASAAVDILQVPAFLCRQTDLLLAVGATGKPVNIKKGQWLPPAGMAGAVQKVKSGKTTEVAVTERGTAFGYGDLVVDPRSFMDLKRATGAAVVFDATHSAQKPAAGEGGRTSGDPRYIEPLMLAAAAAGADGFFIETHPDPANAITDAATMWPLDKLEALLARTLAVWQTVRQ